MRKENQQTLPRPRVPAEANVGSQTPKHAPTAVLTLPRASRATPRPPHACRRAQRTSTGASEPAEPLPGVATAAPPAATTPQEAFVAANPHCWQILTEAIAKYNPSTAYADFSELRQTITRDSLRAEYTHRDDRHRSTYYRGPLKLLLSDLNFLNRWSDASSGAPYTIVYAGAAPGHHIGFLAGLFPKCKFILYDSSAFADSLPANVAARRKLFSSEVAAALAAELREEKVLFISNIRSCRAADYSAEDMSRQREWARIMRPEAAMLKFCLPWVEGATPYLDGTLVFQPFASQASTVSRLIVRREQLEADEKMYDNREYEEQLAHHNMVGRVHGYSHGVVFEGLDCCYDCSVFVAVARDYLGRARGAAAADDAELLRRFIAETLSAIESSQYSRVRAVSKFDSIRPRSDARRWRAD